MRQLASRLVVTEEHVGHAVALAAGQPDHQHGVHAVDDRLDGQGSAGDENHHHLLARGLGCCDQADVIAG